MLIYISGPMSGLKEFNKEAFSRAANHLEYLGHKLYSPAEWIKTNERDFNIRAAFKDYCNYITEEADAIFMLHGWDNSHGARVEHDLAKRIGLIIIYEHHQGEYFYPGKDEDAFNDETNTNS